MSPRRLGAAGDRIGGALDLADHGAEFELQQFQDFLGGITLGEAAASATAAAAGTLGSTGAAVSGTRFRNKPNAMGTLKS